LIPISIWYVPTGISVWWCSPKYADLDKTEIDVKESEIESFQMIQQLF
jgi:hypothetical protein